MSSLNLYDLKRNGIAATNDPLCTASADCVFTFVIFQDNLALGFGYIHDDLAGFGNIDMPRQRVFDADDGGRESGLHLGALKAQIGVNSQSVSGFCSNKGAVCR